MDAVCLQDRRVFWLDADRFREVLQGKALGVPKAVLRLGGVFADEIVGQMAINAFGMGVMTGFLPAVKGLTHDVTVSAGARIAAEVGNAFRIPKGIGAQTD